LTQHSHIAAAGVALGRRELTERVGEALALLDVKPEESPGLIGACLFDAFDAMLPSGFVWRGRAGEIEAEIDTAGQPENAGFILSPGYDLPHPRREDDTAGDPLTGRSVEFSPDALAGAAASAAAYIAWRKLRLRWH
jgi:hypothetical protein